MLKAHYFLFLKYLRMTYRMGSFLQDGNIFLKLYKASQGAYNRDAS